MNMKEHILTALREQFNAWEELLASLSEEQITASHFDHDWSIQDVVAHLWACQQVSAARMEVVLAIMILRARRQDPIKQK